MSFLDALFDEDEPSHDYIQDGEGDEEYGFSDDDEEVVDKSHEAAVDPTLLRRPRQPLTVALPIPRAVDGDAVLLKDHFYVVSSSFGVRAVEYVFAPNVVRPDDDVWTAFLRFMDSIFDMVEREFNGRDFVQFTIYSRDLHDNRMSFPISRVDSLSRDAILDRMEAVVQSNHNVAIDSGDFSVEVQHVVVPEARGFETARKLKHRFTNGEEDDGGSRSNPMFGRCRP